MPDALLLELEGVIADTAALREQSLGDALRAEGVSSAGAADEVTRELITLRAERGFLALLEHGITVRPGARAFIESAAGRTRLAVVTRASRNAAGRLLEATALADHFEFVCTATDVPRPKPDPASYTRAVERLSRRGRLERGRIIALEDGRAGIRAARAAGLRCAAVGEVPPEVALEADLFLPSLADATLDGIAPLVAGEKHRVR